MVRASVSAMTMALIRPDVAMGDLLKTQPGSQLFTVFSAPRVKGPTRQKDGEYVIEVEGMDVYDLSLIHI